MNLQRIYTAVVAKVRSMLTTKKTVDSIVASINGQVEQLRVAAQRHRDEASNAYAKADALNDAGDTSIDEASRAARIAGNLSRLVS